MKETVPIPWALVSNQLFEKLLRLFSLYRVVK